MAGLAIGARQRHDESGPALKRRIGVAQVRGVHRMRKGLMAWVVAAVFGLVSASSDSFAAPIDGAGILHALQAASPVQKARIFCFDKYSGRFLHWGVCHPTVPRVFCKNRYTGQFLYWGACRY